MFTAVLVCENRLLLECPIYFPLPACTLSPSPKTQVEISFYLLRRLLGVKTQEGGKQAKVQKLQRQEILMVNIGSTASGGKVLAVKQDLAKILLTQPVCTQEGEKIALSRRVDKVRTAVLVERGGGGWWWRRGWELVVGVGVGGGVVRGWRGGCGRRSL